MTDGKVEAKEGSKEREKGTKQMNGKKRKDKT